MENKIQQKKYKEFWIERGSFCNVVHESREKLNGWTIAEPIRVIEYEAYTELLEKLQLLTKKLGKE